MVVEIHSQQLPKRLLGRIRNCDLLLAVGLRGLILVEDELSGLFGINNKPVLLYRQVLHLILLPNARNGHIQIVLVASGRRISI